MEKRVLLGVQKKKMPNKPNKKITKKKLFLKKIIDYLKSDSYLFASLISSSSSSNYRSLNSIEIREKDKKESKKKLVKKIGDYLMSDSYLYSPMLFVPSKSIHISPRETQPLIKSGTTVEFARRSISFNDKKKSENEIKKGHKSTDSISIKDIKDQKCLVHMETVKKAIYQNCWPSTVSEKGMLSSQLRKALLTFNR